MKKMFLIVISVSVALDSFGMRFNRMQNYYGYENYLRSINNIEGNKSNQEPVVCPLISSPAAWNELRLSRSFFTNFIPPQPSDQRSIETREIQSGLSVDTSEWNKYINWDPEKPSTSFISKTPITKLDKKSADLQLIDSIFAGLCPSNMPQPKVAGNSIERSSCFIPVNPQSVSSYSDCMPQVQAESNSAERLSCFIPVNPQPTVSYFESIPQTQDKSNSIEKSSESPASNVHKSNQFKQIYHKHHKKRPSLGIRSHERLSTARRLTPAFTKEGYQNVFRISNATVSNDIAYGLARGIIKETRSQYRGMYYTFSNSPSTYSTQP